MFKLRIAPMLLLLVFSMQSANAFWDPPYITPLHPRANEAVSVNVHGGVCDAIISQPSYPRVTRDGNTIRITYFTLHYDNPELRNLPVGTVTDSIGTYSQGAYTLQIDLSDRYFGHNSV